MAMRVTMRALKSFLGNGGLGLVKAGQVFDGGAEWRQYELRKLAVRVQEVTYSTKVVRPSEVKPVTPETPEIVRVPGGGQSG